MIDTIFVQLRALLSKYSTSWTVPISGWVMKKLFSIAATKLQGTPTPGRAKGARYLPSYMGGLLWLAQMMKLDG